FVNFVILAPIMIQAGDIVARVGPDGAVVPLSRAEIVNQWSLWWGVTMMVVGSLVSLFGRPEIFKGLFKRRAKADGPDVLKDIEFPLWISAIGLPIFCALGAWVSHAFFGVPWLLTAISLPLILVLSVICTNSMALTSWTPTGALSKITQFTMGAIDRTNPASNLIPAGMTAEVAANAANLLSDIKPGYMLGGKPRQQAVGHVIGIFSGAIACVPLFFLLFLQPDAHGVRSVSTMVSDQFAFPGAQQWKGIAELITKGVGSLPHSAVVSMIVAAIAAAVIEVARMVTRGRFPLSAVSIGLGVVLPPESTLAMWAGAMVFWAMKRRYSSPGSGGNRFWVEGMEPICAGLISGSALMGIGNAIVNVLMG
ncbi:MAG: OPT/YSL family transporter, partial [Acetobacteraceae bacterium]